MKDEMVRFAEQRVVELQAAQDDLQAEILKLRIHLHQNHTQLEAWKTVLQAEKGELPALANQARERMGPLPDEPTKYGHYTRLVREVLHTFGEAGVTPSEMKRWLEERGTKTSAGFVSNALFRLKNNNEVVFRNGRYYPVQDTEIKVLHDAALEEFGSAFFRGLRPKNTGNSTARRIRQGEHYTGREKDRRGEKGWRSECL